MNGGCFGDRTSSEAIPNWDWPSTISSDPSPGATAECIMNQKWVKHQSIKALKRSFHPLLTANQKVMMVSSLVQTAEGCKMDAKNLHSEGRLVINVINWATQWGSESLISEEETATLISVEGTTTLFSVEDTNTLFLFRKDCNTLLRGKDNRKFLWNMISPPTTGHQTDIQ